MKTNELKDLSQKEKIKKAYDLKGELFNLRIQNLSGSLENTSKIRATRREIARLQTLANQENVRK